MGCLIPIAWAVGEAWLLWWLAGQLGAATLVLILIVKAVFAWQLVGLWGRRAAARARDAMARGEAIDARVLSGPALLFGTLMLVPPAPVLNALGVLLVLPTRWILVGLLRKRLEAALRSGRFVVVDFGGGAGDGVIDVEATEVKQGEDDVKKLGPGGGAGSGT
jgi:UPF0716 family protein affecting phage T7 exclusion